MTSLFRVQLPNGNGIYAFGGRTTRERNALDRMAFRHSDASHPGPNADRLLGETWYGMKFSEREHWEFAFATKTQLREWFGSYHDRRALKCVDARLTIVEAPAEFVHYGMTQAIYRADHATKTVLDNAALLEAVGA